MKVEKIAIYLEPEEKEMILRASKLVSLKPSAYTRYVILDKVREILNKEVQSP